MDKMTIDDFNFKGKTALMRVDFNVPVKDGVVTNDTRITATLPSIEKITGEGGKLILMSHLGRPKGEAKPEFSLKPVAEKLTELTGKSVTFVEDCIGDAVKDAAASLGDGDILLLENLRFHKAEKKNDPEFSKQLAALGDVYVNDAFGTAHRAHASTAGITEFLKPCLAGYLMKKEIEVMGKSISQPEHPFVAIIGGAKVSSKIGVLDNLIDVVDKFIIGGGMAFTFYKAQGLEIGKSIVEEDKIDLAREIMEKAEAKGIPFLLPIDLAGGSELKEGIETVTFSAKEIPADMAGFDIGPETIELFNKELATAKLVIWNGPMGVFEVPPFHKGTESIARFIGDLENATTIVGGGDSIAAVDAFGLKDKMTHVSTGGGASLEMMEGKELPGIVALTDR